MDTELGAVIGQPRSQFAQISITAAICMAALIIGVLAVKYLSPKNYEKIREWYTVYILDETAIDDFEDTGAADEI